MKTAIVCSWTTLNSLRRTSVDALLNVRVTGNSNGELKRETTGKANSPGSPVLEGIIKSPGDHQISSNHEKMLRSSGVPFRCDLVD